MRTRTLITLTALLFVLSFSAGTTHAQVTPAVKAAVESSEQDGPRWKQVFGEQLKVLLNAPDAHRKERALQLIVTMAQRSNENFNFQPVVPTLFEIYETSAQPGHRMLALSALTAIDSPEITEQLAKRILQQDNKRVRKQALRVLAVRLEGNTQ